MMAISMAITATCTVDNVVSSVSAKSMSMMAIAIVITIAILTSASVTHRCWHILGAGALFVVLLEIGDVGCGVCVSVSAFQSFVACVPRKCASARLRSSGEVIAAICSRVYGGGPNGAMLGI